MNSTWVTFANSEYDAKRLSIDKLPYPLCMHVPAGAFTHDPKLYVPASAPQAFIGVELCFKLKKQVFQSEPELIESAIESFHAAVSLTSNYHISEIESRIVKPRLQDYADTEYMTRWWDQSTYISESLNSDWSELNSSSLSFSVGSENRSVRVSYYHDPIALIKFVSDLNSLDANTYICMGSLDRVEFATSDLKNLSVNLNWAEASIPPIALNLE